MSQVFDYSRREILSATENREVQGARRPGIVTCKATQHGR